MRWAGGTNCCRLRSRAVEPRGIAQAPQRSPSRKGASFSNMSLRMRRLKGFPTIFSLIFITGFGVAGGLYILAKKTFFVPEVSWEKKNHELWNNRSPSDQYKLFAMSMDSKDLKKDRRDC